MYLEKLLKINSILKCNIKGLHKYIYKMDKAYLRHTSDNDRVELSFHYANPNLKVNRQFNFCRRLSETISTFLVRVSANVEKAVNKKKKKKSNAADIEPPSIIKTMLKLDDVEVDSNLTCSQVFKPENNLILQVLEKEYKLIINSPWVDNISLPNAILANFPVYPTKFECSHTDKKLSNFTWFKSEDKKSWRHAGSGFFYVATNEDVNYYLKLNCIPRNGEAEGPEVEVVSDVEVQASPGECPFEIRHKFTKERTTGKEFRVVSYNILADLYCDSDFTRQELHPYCPAYALHIDYRKLLIVKELLGYNADIICLQEVDRKVFQNDLEPIFSNLDYGCDFAIKGGLVAEGVACFYNMKRFKPLESTRIVLSEHISKDPLYSDLWELVSQNTKLSERILDRQNIVQTVALESHENNEIVLVANTHLYFHPDADHIRLLQSGFIIKYVQYVYEKLREQYKDERISLIFCGDFNSVPECGIYKLFTTGSVSQDCIDFQSNKEEAVHNVNLVQPFPLASACGTPKYTNFTAGFADCLDYIFYDKSKLEVSMVVPLPSVEELSLHTALPSIVFPSDHIALISDLKWT